MAASPRPFLVRACASLAIVAFFALFAAPRSLPAADPDTALPTAALFPDGAVTSRARAPRVIAPGVKCDSLAAQPLAQQCRLAVATCESASLLPYLQMYYCTPPAARPLLFAALLAVLVLLFYVLGVSAGDFFVPVLTVISSLCALSPEVAGVTILAFGNGAPDVFSVFVAVKRKSFHIAIGELLGAGCFITMVVVGLITFISPLEVSRVFLFRNVITYIAGLSLLSAVLFFEHVHLWQATVFLLAYVAFVAGTVGAQVWQRAEATREQRHLLPAEAPAHANDGAMEAAFRLASDSPVVLPAKTRKDAGSDTFTWDDVVPSSRHGTPMGLDPVDELLARRAPLEVPSPDSFSSSLTSVESLSAAESVSASPMSPLEPSAWDMSSSPACDGSPSSSSPTTPKPLCPLHATLDCFCASTTVIYGPTSLLGDPAHTPSVAALLNDCDHTRMVGKLRVYTGDTSPSDDYDGGDLESIASNLIDGDCAPSRAYQSPAAPYSPWAHVVEQLEWHSMGWPRRALLLATLPVHIALLLTIPRVERHTWNPRLAALIPVFAPLLVLVATRSATLAIAGTLPLAAVVAGGGACLGVGVYLTCPAHPANLPHYHPVFVLAGFAMAIVWIYLVCNELVTLLESMGHILDISHAILGMTVLTWGNSVGDMVSNTLLAREGAAGMALSACYGAPLFNLLFGMGLSLTWQCVRFFPHPYIVQGSQQIRIAFAFLVVGLVATLVVVPLCRFTYTRAFGLALVALYVVSSGVNVAVELWNR